MRIITLLKGFSKSTRLYRITKTATIAQFHSKQSLKLPEICWLRASVWIYPSAVLTLGSIAFHTYASGQEEEDDSWRPPFRKDLPTFRAEEVKLHNEKDRKLWVTFRGGVYDITEFVDVHPGGKIIMQAVGGPLEPHWQRYNFHKQEDVYSMLEEMRIGNLHPDDVEDAIHNCDTVAEEVKPGYTPKLHPSMNVKSVQPLNAETGIGELVESFYTPNELFFKRNHHAIPTVDERNYKLKVSGVGLEEREFTLEDLKTKFQPVSVVVTLQCAGNRRQDFNAVKPVRGLQWGPGAIGNAKWTGALLVDVLKEAGFQSIVENGAEHVQFTGLDDNGTGEPYGASIPIDVAMKPGNQVILAYSMNDKPIPVEHGFPVRVVVPGVVGARSVKWLASIVLSKDESPSQWQQSDYKTFNPSTDWPTANFSTVQAIQELPVQSAICSPAENSSFPRGTKTIAVKGYAWSGGGRDILRVEVSADNGNTWHSADLQLHIHERRNARFAWTLWTCEVPTGCCREKLRYGGTVNEDVDVKGEADAKNTVMLDFYDENGQPLRNSNVKLGDEVKLVIAVNETRTFKQILPQMCYFSAFDVSDVKALNDSYNLIFVKNGCFNKRNPVVKAIVPPMERNENGTSYQLNFQAFHFTNHGRNLYIHCSLLACVGNQVECKPKRNCFSTGRRRKRNALVNDEEETDEEEQQQDHLQSDDLKHIQLSRYIVVDDGKASTSTVQPSVKSESISNQICMQWWQFTAIVATPVLFVTMLLVLVAWQAGRFSRENHKSPPHSCTGEAKHHHYNTDKNGHSHFVKL
ncbi:putative sulfite oxidase, mitochondrial, partial [Trichinella sp. T9]